MASLVGYPHQILESYHGSILATIESNARLGQGLSNFCDEIDA
ncbi:MAG TPA: hypothetical protein VG844_07655 [Terracidiphilus sp.]|nr:hypothetical protein [Terracidiphilus sp.]